MSSLSDAIPSERTWADDDVECGAIFRRDHLQ